MKKRVVTGLVLVVVLLLAAASQASAGAKRIEVSSYEYDCFTGFAEGGGVWGDEEGVTHVRSILHSNPNVSDTPELNGMHHTVADGEFNGVTGNASIRGSSDAGMASWRLRDPLGREGESTRRRLVTHLIRVRITVPGPGPEERGARISAA